MYHYHGNSKQPENEIKQERRCKVCHINARNAIYLISYLTFCLDYLKHVQNFSLKHSATQELSYIENWYMTCECS